ncbi:unnamed protein product [Linum tenue]|uniref:At4g14310 8-bladed propeller domain-containing protein n=1 Tax=Linum tenue TaxID=586396 RepID=A0AAV0RNZ2_9ROSI|nr:unnamed protein product [Linum tenue]
MSAPSTRRLRDRDGAAAPKSAASQKSVKTLTPVSSTDKNPSPTIKISSSGPRLGSRAQRPAIRPVPRVDKAAVSAAAAAESAKGADVSEGRPRWSASSVPRGRSQSPSDFIRVLRDSRVPKGESDRRALSSAGKKSGSRFIRDDKENGVFSAEVAKTRPTWEAESNSSRLKSLNSNRTAENVVGMGQIKRSEGSVVDRLNSVIKATESLKLDKLGRQKTDSDSKFDFVRGGSGHKSAGKVRVSESRKEKGLVDEGTGNRGSDGYSSRLHEKLAFLEGKVKRIASDIKRTKEMLDMNNPDASKVVLSDIQEKICGIEQAMVHVVGDPSKADVKDQVENNEAKPSVKVLNNEDLEARLFPHQKLLRDRTSLKVSSGASQKIQDVGSIAVESTGRVKADEKLLVPAEESPIESEFLASLSKKENKSGERSAYPGPEACDVQDADSVEASQGSQDSSKMFEGKAEDAFSLTADEKLEDFDDAENRPALIAEQMDEASVHQLNLIGIRSSTAGWFVSEGESVLLAHDDGSCSFYDITNSEEKAVYKPPAEVSLNMWRDCWIIRAPNSDGCSDKYVVAASAGNSLDAGFCSWDFYTKTVRAFHIEDHGVTTAARTILGPLPNTTGLRRNALSSSTVGVSERSRQWWYRPCGHLIASSASTQSVVKVFDIRDGEQMMKWESQTPVMGMDYSSPVQWRNRGKVIVAESESVSVWDVNSRSPQSLSTIQLSGRKVTALSVVNTDAELGGGVRQRVTSAEAEGNDGVFCTTDAINVMDLRNPSGIGLKIPKMGVNAESVFTRGDSIFIGCTSTRSLAGKRQPCSQVQHYSLRKQRLASSYSLPESETHSHHAAITQVWGNSNYVMAVSGLGLFVFDASRDDETLSAAADCGIGQKVNEVIGPDDLYAPTFDYLGSRVLLISRDRPALWRYML